MGESCSPLSSPFFPFFLSLFSETLELSANEFFLFLFPLVCIAGSTIADSSEGIVGGQKGTSKEEEEDEEEVIFDDNGNSFIFSSIAILIEGEFSGESSCGGFRGSKDVSRDNTGEGEGSTDFFLL